ncbi:MAG TPA: GNAT family N-acetyltransferase [Actinomycetes bacterium]|nr:GNAT family N-acetyltransferase [Actinomycetes bacterium]
MPYLVPPVVPAGRMRRRSQPVLRAAGGLVLRPWEAADAPAVLEAYLDPAIQRWNLRAFASLDEAEGWIAQWERQWLAERDGCWAVTDGAGTVLSRVALRGIRLMDGVADCTYWVLPAARGQGVATAATVVVARWALDELGLHRLELQHSTANPASCRVAAKAGFAVEGTLRSAMRHPDGWHDMHLHARVQGDPEAAPAPGPAGA